MSRAPELEPNLPNWDWDDAYRTAGRCFMDNLQSSQGSDGVERYLIIVEDYAAHPITSLAQTFQQPPEMMAPEVTTAIQSCGVQTQIMQRLKESGLMGAMMNEAMIAKLGG